MDTIKKTCRMPKVMRIGSKIVIGVMIAVGFAFVFGLFVMMLWNWIMPDIFNLQQINYWQAFGIVLLARLLVGSSGDHDGHDKHDKHDKHYLKLKLSGKDGSDSNRDETDRYDEWWEQEGEASFKEYVDRKCDQPSES